MKRVRKKEKLKIYKRVCRCIILVCALYMGAVFVYRGDVSFSVAGHFKRDREAIDKEANNANLELPTVKIEDEIQSVAVIIENNKADNTINKPDNQLATVTNQLTKAQLAKLKENTNIIKLLRKDKKSSYLINNFFTVDATTSVTEEMMNPKKLLSYDLTIKDVDNKKENVILIYHTHSSEAFKDSVKGKRSDTVVGVGDYLTKLLEEKGYTVIHDTTAYDIKDGKWNRESYDTALPSLKKYVSENKNIIVTIDLHRNSGKEKAVTTINGVDTAQIMLFNGVSRNKNGERTGLVNKNLQGNLAFSLRLLMCSMEKYPDFAKKTYIKGYRYNLHLVPRALLVEVGNDKNTVAEAKAAMVPFAEMLDSVLTGEYK